MNFEHEPKEEYYEIGKEGVGRFITSPLRNYENDNGQKVIGGFSGKHDDKAINNEWLTDKLLSQIESTFSYSK